MSEQDSADEKLLREIELLKQKLEVYEQRASDQFSQIEENQTISSILNAVPHALVGLIDRKIVFANNAVKTVFNLEADKAIGQSTRMFYRSDQDFKRIADLFYPILEGKECFVHEFPCRTYDGRDIICNVSAARLGSVLKNQTIVVMYEDITERKQAERENKYSQKLLQRIIDLLPIRIFWKDKNLRFLGCNQIFAKDAGYNSVEDMIGKDDFQMGWREQAEIYQADDRAIIQSKQVKLNFEEPQTTPAGNKIWLRTSKVPLVDPVGNEIGILGTYEDITERKQIEAGQILFRSLMEQSQDGVFIIEPETGQFIDVNQYACLSLGYDKAELLTKTVMDIDPLFTPEKFSNHIQQDIKKNFKALIETIHQRKDGSQFPVEINSQLSTIGEKQYIISIARDISERKQEQAWLLALNKLKEELLSPGLLADKLKRITDQTVSIFNADFARIWMINPGDICDNDCLHAKNQQPEHICRFKDKCLHLMASSGAYTDIVNSRHKRVPFDCYKIGKIASGKDLKFISNDVVNDSRIHEHQWVKERGLVAFAGYRVLSQGKTIGVFALFSKQEISANMDAKLESIANVIGLIIQTAEIERTLRQSAADWHRTFDAINDLIFILDTNNFIVRVNKAFADFLKLPVQEIEGRKCHELIHNKSHIFPGCPLVEAKKDHQEHSAEIDDPNIGIPLLITISPIFDQTGQMIGAVHIAKNISKEKQAEKELKRKLHDLEIFRKSSVGREMRMLEMKKKIEELEAQIALKNQHGGV